MSRPRDAYHPFRFVAFLCTACAGPGSPGDHTTAADAQPTAVTSATATTEAAAKPDVAAAKPDHAGPTGAAPFTGGAQAFAAVRDALLHDYYREGLNEDDLYRAAVRGMLEHADPKMHTWNRLLTPGELAETEADLKGEIVGAGVLIHFDSASGYIDVLDTVLGAPAERAGIVAGDKIVTVDGKLFKGKTEHDVLDAVRGKAGEEVVFTLLRGDKLVSTRVTRAPVAFETVHHALAADGVGCLQVDAFTQKTAPLVRAALDDFARQGARGVVVDLRDNEGGLFDQAIATAELFVAKGTPVARLRHRGDKLETFTSQVDPPLASLPMTVVIDGKTSSGAELVAAALQEARHATVVGTHTFGKWSVQTIKDLSNKYAYKLTISAFETPSGRSFEGTGLPADVEVAAPDSPSANRHCARDLDRQLASDTQLRTAFALVRARL